MQDPFFSHYGLHLTAIMPTHPEAVWQPAVDLYRCAGGWVVKFELAGVRQEDVEVRLDAGGITVLGTRLDRRPYQLEEAHLRESAMAGSKGTSPFQSRFTTFNTAGCQGGTKVVTTRPNESSGQE